MLSETNSSLLRKLPCPLVRYLMLVYSQKYKGMEMKMSKIRSKGHQSSPLRRRSRYVITHQMDLKVNHLGK